MPRRLLLGCFVLTVGAVFAAYRLSPRPGAAPPDAPGGESLEGPLTPGQRYEARRQAVRAYLGGRLTEEEAVEQFRAVLDSIPRSGRYLGYLGVSRDQAARKQFREYLREATSPGGTSR